MIGPATRRLLGVMFLAALVVGCADKIVLPPALDAAPGVYAPHDGGALLAAPDAAAVEAAIAPPSVDAGASETPPMAVPWVEACLAFDRADCAKDVACSITPSSDCAKSDDQLRVDCLAQAAHDACRTPDEQSFIRCIAHTQSESCDAYCAPGQQFCFDFCFYTCLESAVPISTGP